jgi:hypothetical protein
VHTSEVQQAEFFQRGGSATGTVKVRVLLPGVRDEVELRWINPPFGQPLTPAFTPGWATATPTTGYAAPLPVRYLRQDGDAVVMAQPDIDAAVAQDPPHVGAARSRIVGAFRPDASCGCERGNRRAAAVPLLSP